MAGEQRTANGERKVGRNSPATELLSTITPDFLLDGKMIFLAAIAAIDKNTSKALLVTMTMIDSSSWTLTK